MNPVNHVAIIMDGNGRWGIKYKNSRNAGHKAGLNTVEKIIKETIKNKIKFLTLFAFSTENWKRTQAEVAGLMSLFESYILKEAKNLKDSGVRVRFIGDRVKLESKLVDLMDDLEMMTQDNDLVHLTIAINYGGRDEVARATRRLARDVELKKISARDINEETLPKYLDTHVLPDPDLVIRTSGEARISNFLLWQSAYSEYEFIDTLWPDFTAEIFAKVIHRYSKRLRRFGGVAV